MFRVRTAVKLSVPAVAAAIPPATLASYAQSIGWPLAEQTLGDTTTRGAFKTLYEALDRDLQDRIFRDFEDIEVVCAAANKRIVFDILAKGDPLVDILERLQTNRARALHLLTHHKTPHFERAVHAAIFSSKRGPTRQWQGFLLGALSRDWEGEAIDLEVVTSLVREVVKTVEGLERGVEVDHFVRPATEKRWEGPRLHQFAISIEDRSDESEEWADGRLTRRPVIPNRKLEIVVIPYAKTIECVGSQISPDLSAAVTRAFAKDVLEEPKALEGLPARILNLKHLKRRPDFPTHKEDKIGSVRVTKLVVLAGARGATATYFAPARSELDAYDVAAAATGKMPDRAIGSRFILAASIRVEFERVPGRKQGSAVTFDLTYPHKCSLSEEREAERHILQTYLPAWGFVSGSPQATEPPEHAERMAALCEICEQPGTARPEADLKELFGPSFDWLVAETILAASGSDMTTTCGLCDDTNPVDIAFDRDREVWGFLCDTHGWQPREQPVSLIYRMDFASLLRSLGVALGATSEARRPLRPDRSGVLGVCHAPRAWTAFFARGLDDEATFDALHSDLTRGAGKDPGLILTSSGVARSTPWPGGNRLAHLGEVIELTDTGMVARAEAIARLLDGVKPRRKSGRTTLREEGLAIGRARRKRELAESDRDLATAILEELDRRYPVIDTTTNRRKAGVRLPTHKTVLSDWLPHL